MNEFMYNFDKRMITMYQYADWKRRHPNEKISDVEVMFE